MIQILIFGDSISYGYGDKEGGWVQRLKNSLDKKILINNLGVSGDTTEDVLIRFESETKERLKEKNPVIAFAVGINNSQLLYDQKIIRTKPEKFKENIKKLIELAKSFSSKIVFVGLTPVDELKVNPIPWSPEKSYNNKNIKEFNNIIKSICDEHKVYFIEIFEKWINSDYKVLLEDGVHPNSKGHQKIFEIVKDFLIKNKIVIF